MRVRGYHRIRGISLIELVVVIVLLGILSGVLATILHGPMLQYVDTQRRTTLVEIAEIVLLRMSRELRLALPNSLRISANARAIEVLRTIDGGSYRRLADPADVDTPCGSSLGDVLDFSMAADCFEVLGNLIDASGIETGGGNQSDCIQNLADCLVIYNTGQAGANAYAGDNIATITGVTPSSISFDNSGDVPGFSFPFLSPQQRFQVVDTPVSFVCDLGRGEIRRLSDYNMLVNQPTDIDGSDFTASAGRLNNDLLANRISDCRFTYTPGTGSRAGLVTLHITIADTELGEAISTFQQLHISNQP